VVDTAVMLFQTKLRCQATKGNRVGRFLSDGGKRRFFRGKNRTGKNSFCRKKRFFARIRFHQNKIHLFLFVFDLIKLSL